jgi:hypothetical protein
MSCFNLVHTIETSLKIAEEFKVLGIIFLYFDPIAFNLAILADENTYFDDFVLALVGQFKITHNRQLLHQISYDSLYPEYSILKIQVDPLAGLY